MLDGIFISRRSNFSAAEEVVIFALWAMCAAAQAASEKNRNTDCYNHSANNSVCSKPMEKAMHIQSPHVTRPET